MLQDDDGFLTIMVGLFDFKLDIKQVYLTHIQFHWWKQKYKGEEVYEESFINTLSL